MEWPTCLWYLILPSLSGVVRDDFSNFADTQTDETDDRMGLPSPHSHYSPPEEIAIIEAAGKIPRNRERGRDAALTMRAYLLPGHFNCTAACHRHATYFIQTREDGGAGLGQ